MKKLILFITLLFFVSGLDAAIGWSGNIYPNSGSDHTNGTDITVYYQIWKDGVTNNPGQGDSISATLYYKKSAETNYQSVAMVYNTDVGNNDEYQGTIPNTYFYSGDTIHFYCEAYDSTDGTYSYGTDQNNAGPYDETNPGTYNIILGLNQDVTVTFQVDMTYVASVGSVSVAGTFNSWTPGTDTLADPDADEVFTGDVLFTRGTNPNQEYKFVNGSNWEAISNRILEISDSSSTMVLEVDYFNIQNPDDIITSDVTVSFGVYMGALDTTWYNKGVSVQGNTDPLDWSQGSNLMSDGNDDLIFTKDILFTAGSNKYVEYKYSRCDNDSIWNYEGLAGNRTFTIDDTSPTQNLEWVYWANDIPAPANLSITVSGDDVEISWNAVFGATDYKVLRSSEPYDNFAEIDNTGGATNYTDPGAGSKYRAEKLFYQIKAVR